MSKALEIAKAALTDIMNASTVSIDLRNIALEALTEIAIEEDHERTAPKPVTPHMIKRLLGGSHGG